MFLPWSPVSILLVKKLHQYFCIVSQHIPTEVKPMVSFKQSGSQVKGYII